AHFAVQPNSPRSTPRAGRVSAADPVRGARLRGTKGVLFSLRARSLPGCRPSARSTTIPYRSRRSTHTHAPHTEPLPALRALRGSTEFTAKHAKGGKGFG